MPDLTSFQSSGQRETFTLCAEPLSHVISTTDHSRFSFLAVRFAELLQAVEILSLPHSQQQEKQVMTEDAELHKTEVLNIHCL